MFITIVSGNPDLGYVLRKNPHSGMAIKRLRKGFVCGWFSDLSKYHLWYTDSVGTMSFSPERYDYLDNHSRVNPVVYINSLKTLLNDAVFKPEQRDVITSQLIVVQRIRLKQKMLSLLPDQFETEHIAGDVYKLTFNAVSTLQQALQQVYLHLSLHIHQKELDSRGEGFTQSVVNTLQPSSHSYTFLRTFINKVVSNRKEFDTVKLQLDAACTLTTDFKYSRLNDLRYDWARLHLANDTDVVDLGAGEGKMLRFFKKRQDRIVCVDSDEKVRHLLSKKRERVPFEYEVMSSFSDVELNRSTSVLLLEVLEHNTLEAAAALLTQVCNEPLVTEVLLTTPNKAFNQHYGMSDDQMRHDDHKWEMTFDQFQQWLHSLNLNRTVEWHHIGDCVEQNTPTIGAILR